MAATLELEAALPDKEPSLIPKDDEIPDGGFGWVVAFAICVANATTWGMNSAFGVFLSFYLAEDYFPGATPLQFAFVGGLSISQGLMIAPLANYLTQRYHFKAAVGLGIVGLVLGQILAGFSTKIWHLFLTQGVLFGWGLGLIFVPILPLLAQWFSAKRSLANGVAAAGSGIGGLIFSNTTRLAIANLSLKMAFVINGLISLAIMLPVFFLLKSRTKLIGANFKPFDYTLLLHPGYCFVILWAIFAMLGYIVALFTLASYATVGLGLDQRNGAAIQSALSAGMIIGRPLCGWVLDRIGHINGAALFSLVSGFEILFIWMFAGSMGVLLLFAILQGATAGIIWQACGPASAQVVGLKDLGSALSVLWLIMVVPATCSEAITLSLVEYSRDHLGRTGANAFVISIGVAGGCYVLSAILLMGAKRYVQGNYKAMQKT